MVTDALLESFPVARYDASVAGVLNEIREFQKLPADWDAEGAQPVSPSAARLASWLVQMVAHSAQRQGIPWEPPVVGPSADGGINLEWEGRNHQVLMMVRPDQEQVVECVIEETGVPPKRETISAWDAIDRALWVTDHN